MMLLLFLFLFYPRNLPLKFVKNWVSNRQNVAFVIVVVVVVIAVIVVVWLKSDQEQLIYCRH